MGTFLLFSPRRGRGDAGGHLAPVPAAAGWSGANGAAAPALIILNVLGQRAPAAAFGLTWT